MKNISFVVLINLIVLSLDLWDCGNSVRRNHDTADETRVKKPHTSE